jgi:hypothetical protein
MAPASRPTPHRDGLVDPGLRERVPGLAHEAEQQRLPRALRSGLDGDAQDVADAVLERRPDRGRQACVPQRGRMQVADGPAEASTPLRTAARARCGACGSSSSRSWAAASSTCSASP